MMTGQKDIYRSAQLLINEYESAAEDYAIDMMHEFMARDDAKGASIWLAIADAVRILRQNNPQGAQVH